MSKFAVIKTGGKQYLVEEGDKIKIEKLPQEEGEEVKFDKVLMRATNRSFKVGDPEVDRYKVEGKIVEQGRDDKVVVYKKKAKKRYEKKQGHRQPYSIVEIESI